MVTRAIKTFFLRIVFLASALVACNIGILQAPQAFAACTTSAPATTYGQVTQSVSVSTAGTYSAWSRIKAPDATNNSYYLQIDGGCAYNVGDSTNIPANSWTWVNYQDGNSSSTIVVSLSAGMHTLTYTGREAGVELDRVLFLGDQTCVPTGTGDTPACVNPDVTPPTVTVTAPAANASITAGTTVALTATASDSESGVAKVQFSVDGQAMGTPITVSPYTYKWNTTGVAAGSHVIRAQAYDNAGNSQTSTAITVNVSSPTPTSTPAPTSTPSPTSTPAPTQAPTPMGDANGDQKVNYMDLGIVLTHYGQNYAPADFYHDGVVGANDLALVLTNWTF